MPALGKGRQGKGTSPHKKMICIGERIKNELERQERGVTWLANKLGCSRMAVYRIFEKNSIDTHLLLRISKILQHDFFVDLSDEMDLS